MKNNLYTQVADQLIQQIEDGVYKPGDKLPSVRAMAKQRSVSVSTVLTAYGMLEDRGFVEVRPKSGYYVRRSSVRSHKLPSIDSEDCCQPHRVTKIERIMEVMRDGARQSDFINLSSATPDGNFPMLHQMKKTFSSVVRNQAFLGVGYNTPDGSESLRREIAKRSMDAGILVSPDEIVTTLGCQNALELSLRVLTKPGDIVAVETPCYYGLLQLIESCGLKAIEIPVDADTGMSIDALKLVLEQWPIKTIISIPSHNNPLGTVMPDEHKQQLIDLIEQYDVPLIEDDVYAELGYGNKRPRAIKSFDTRGQVLLCSSVSKTLDPGLRVGWVMPGKYQSAISRQKFVSSVATARLAELAVAEVLSRGSYDRHLRLVRESYRQRRDQMIDLIGEYFPSETRLSKPQGGFVIWVQLPEKVNVLRLYNDARDQGISISPGDIFSLNDKYQSSIRLTYSQPWTPKRVEAIKTLGRLIDHQLQDV